MITDYNVSRETIAKLEEYEDLLRKWSPSINLIAKSTLTEIRSRHIEDSMGLFSMLPSTWDNLVDLGSGGGLPGLVLAILCKEKHPDRTITLIESDQRKATFLRAVSIQLNLNVQILTNRVELAQPSSADVVTARALAPLNKLLEYVFRHLGSEGLALLQKGRTYSDEIALARKNWNFDVEVTPSSVHSESVVLKVTNLKEADQNGS